MYSSTAGRQAPIHLTLEALERSLTDLAEADALVAAAHLETAILALRREMIARGIEPDTEQSVGATN